MKVLAVGAAGASAGLVTRALSAKGVEVRGLVHSAQREAVARVAGCPAPPARRTRRRPRRARRGRGSGLADILPLGSSALANPDIVTRLRAGAELNSPDPSTFYGGDARGYTDYPALAA